jgi:hypothetical protein
MPSTSSSPRRLLSSSTFVATLSQVPLKLAQVPSSSGKSSKKASRTKKDLAEAQERLKRVRAEPRQEEKLWAQSRLRQKKTRLLQDYATRLQAGVVGWYAGEEFGPEQMVRSSLAGGLG